MFIDPRPPRCSECGELLTDLTADGFCILCEELFCQRHLTVRKGVASCRACEEGRLELEQTNGVSEADELRVVTLLLRDLAGTIGPGHESIVEESGARNRLFSHAAVDYEQRVVDDVQQYLHDTFVDTTWPRCPDHPKHPLWYSGGQWRCEQTGRVIAPLGQLSDESTKGDGGQ